jgi:hypothetical protein
MWMNRNFPYLKSILFISLLMLSMRAAAPDVKIVFIIAPQPVRPFEKLLRAVFIVESSGDTLAYNDAEEAVGGLQIRPIRLLDYNLRTGKNYMIKECYNFRISREIFLYYAEHAGTKDYELIARNWNGSGANTHNY